MPCHDLTYNAWALGFFCGMAFVALLVFLCLAGGHSPDDWEDYDDD